MKTADNQLLSAILLFIHTATWNRIQHLKGGEIGGLDFRLKIIAVHLRINSLFKQ